MPCPLDELQGLILMSIWPETFDSSTNFRCRIRIDANEESKPTTRFLRISIQKTSVFWEVAFRPRMNEHRAFRPRADSATQPNSSTSPINSSYLKRPIRGGFYPIFPAFPGNQFCVRTQNLTNNNISGTSIKTPTTVASAAPEDNPKSIVAVAIATSK
jgi:hypothetical protein